MRLVVQPHRLQQFHGAAFRLGHAKQAGLQFQRFKWREKRIEHQFLRHDADAGLGVARVFIDIETPDPRAAGGLVHQPGQDVDHGRFSGAVRPQQAKDAAARDIEIDPLQRLLAAGIDFGQALQADGSFAHACRDRPGREGRQGAGGAG